MNVTTRNAQLSDLMEMLQEQHTRKVDVVAPATAIRSVEGQLRVQNADPIITEDGVTSADGVYVPTAVCDEGLAEKLGVPVGYLKRLREDRPDLYDANVNGWLHGRREKWSLATLDQGTGEMGPGRLVREAIPADPRAFLLRAFRGDDGPGIARAFLSDRYAVVDNLDVLMAALDGVRDAGVAVDIAGGDLSERRMVVRVRCPQVATVAPVLLAGYRSPFTGASGDENPTVFAGFKISNSETGGGAFTIVPEVTVQVCNNGMTMTRDAISKVHVGGRLDAGVVRWAEDTQTAAVALVKKQTRDAVTTFLSPEYLTRAVTRLEERAAEPVAHTEVRTLVKQLRYTEAQMDGILDHFMRGGQATRAGVVNAITSYSQEVTDADAAYDLEARATSLLGV